MPSILQLCRYGRLGSSSRLRMLDFVPFLEAEGFTVSSDCLLNDSVVRAFYEGHRRPWRTVASAYVRRLTKLFSRNKFDLVWIEKEVFPWLPAFFEMTMLGEAPFVMDIDDAWFARYSESANPLVRGILSGKLERIARKAKLVIAGNDVLANWAESAGAQNIEVIPTVVDLLRYSSGNRRSGGRPITVGWIGSPPNAHYLALAADGLRRCGDVKLVVVGGNGEPIPGVRTEHLPWKEKTEAQDVAQFDIGIMPLFDGFWEQGKCGYKLIQYMAAGCPVVASPVGVNVRLVEHGVNGFLARDADEWAEFVGRLVEDPALRAEMGAAGRRMVERSYSIQAVGPRLAEALRRALTEKAG